jgi:hypothetical protein
MGGPIHAKVVMRSGEQDGLHYELQLEYPDSTPNTA